MGRPDDPRPQPRTKGDSVEASDVIAQRLLAQGLHGVNVAAGLLSDEAYAEMIARHSLAALSEHGYSIIRTDPETMNAAIAAALHANHFSGSAPALEAALVESVVRAALVVLRGDPSSE